MVITRTAFVPSRNSRHRIAAIALYRALVKAAQAVPIPPQHGDTPQEQRRQAEAHPLAKIVRRRFDRNKIDISNRLVFASMAAGYKFLTVLAKARTPDTPEHTRVLNILQTQQKTAAASRALTAARSRPPKREPHPPLLVNVAEPGQPPVYEGSPRPKTAFTGPRRVPSLFTSADGIPFLRYTKPQPRELTAMIGKRYSRWLNNVEYKAYVDDKVGPYAAVEDEWEALVARQMRDEGKGRGEGARDMSETYLWSNMLGKLWSEHKIDLMWEDWTARGEALYGLLKAERALAAEEGETPRPQQFGSAPPLAESDRALAAASAGAGSTGASPGHQRSVSSGHWARTLDMRRRAAQEHGYVEGETHDFFATPVWAGMIEQSRYKLVRWMRDTHNWDWDFVDFVSSSDMKAAKENRPKRR